MGNSAFARDKKGHLIPLEVAVRGVVYTCPDCAGDLRLRGGRFRRRHFYHSSKNCTRQGKSETHLEIQRHLHRLLPEGEATIEREFPQINRIADVYWHTRKIVFEIQCSAISGSEIAERNADYARLGFEVVWILHLARFPLRGKSQAQQQLAPRLHYYTNMDRHGRGTIFDPLSMSLTVDLSRPCSYTPRQLNWRRSFKPRALKALFCFAGDGLSLAQGPSPPAFLLAPRRRMGLKAALRRLHARAHQLADTLIDRLRLFP
jgi:hypothetical protein